jgi:hypothetical protein
MFVAMISFTFPIQILMASIFAKLTKRNFLFRTSYILDFCVFGVVFWWFIMYEIYLHADNEGFGL